jgi:hypothetical protein
MHHTNRLLRSLFTTLLCAVFLFASSLSYAAPASALAMDDLNGDYVPGFRGRTHYSQWQVVDSDPNGLNCRSIDPNGGPLDLDHLPRNQIDIPQWPVLKTFKPGTKLEALPRNSGDLTTQINDQRGSSWIAIRTDNQGGSCLVRANIKFVRPLLATGSDGWRCSCRAKDCGSREHPNSFTFEKTTKLDPSSPDYACFPRFPVSSLSTLLKPLNS